MSRILLRVEDYLDIAANHGHHTFEAQAKAAGLGIGTMHRLRNGAPAGERAVAALCATYGVEFNALFVIDRVGGQPAAPLADVA